MVEYNGEFSTCEVEASPVENLGFKPHECLGNAYKVAEQTGAMIVEGVLLLFLMYPMVAEGRKSVVM